MIQPRERFVYYRGIRRSGARRDQAEYFGCGVIGQIWSDPAVPLDAPQRRWAWYCEIENYLPFIRPVPAKIDGIFFETNQRWRR